MFQFSLTETFTERSDSPMGYATACVVARVATCAPCGWIFCDGTETDVEMDAGQSLILPGGAFFPAEAHLFETEADARTYAERLNAASPCFEPPWRALPLAGLPLQTRRVESRMAEKKPAEAGELPAVRRLKSRMNPAAKRSSFKASSLKWLR